MSLVESDAVSRIVEGVRLEQRQEEQFGALDDPVERVVQGVKHDQGGLTDREFNESFVGETIAPPLQPEFRGPRPPKVFERGIGEAFERDGPVTPFKTRATIALLGDTFEEQTATFKALFPGGTLKQIPVTGTVLFKRRPDEPFRELDPSFADAIGAEGFAGFVNEFGNEIADLTGDSVLIAAEFAALAFLRKRGGGKLVSDLLRLGLGGATGEAIRQGTQTAAGTQRQDPDQQLALIAGAGAQSIIGGTIGAGIGAGISALRGRGVVGTTPEGRAAIQASEDIGTVPLMASQVSENPFLRLLSRQSQALVPKIGQYLARQEARTAEALRGAVNKTELGRFIGETARAFNQASKDLLDLTIQATGIRRRSPRAGGRFLQQGVNQWWKVSGNDVDNLYNAARRIDEPVFNSTRLVDEANDIRTGVQARAADPDAPPIRADEELAPAVVRLLDDISGLGETVEGVTGTGTDVLRSFRRRINEFTVAGPEGGRLSHAIATRLRTAIDDTLSNPANLNSSPEFSRAWKTADAAARRRFQTREALAVVDLMKNQTPAQIVNKLARPGQLDNLVAIRKAVPKEEWAKFQEAATTELLLDTKTLTRNLDAFDEPTLNMLMNKPRQQILREAGREFDRLNGPGITQAFERQANIRGFFREVLDTGQTGRIEEFRALVERQGGRDGPLGRPTRAAIINEVWERSRVVEQGISKVDANKIQATLRDFEERGILQFLKEDELKLLRNVELVQDFARLGAKDAGTSLQAASAIADVRGGGIRGLITLVENWTMGRLLTMPRVNKLILGTGRRPLDTAAVKLIGAAGLQIGTTMEQEAALGQDVLDAVDSIVGTAGSLTEF